MRGSTRILVFICCAAVVAAGAVLAEHWWVDRRANELPMAGCGTAVTHRLDGDTQLISAQPGALTCFDTAAHSCASASIQLTERGVDAGIRYVFRIEPGGSPCHAVELSQDYSANFGGSSGEVKSLTCSTVAVTAKGVAFTCGGQDVLIPAELAGQSHTGT